MLTRDSILAAADLKTEDVDVPEWGGVVKVRVFSGASRDRLDAFLTSVVDAGGKLKDPTGLRSLVVILAACDEKGNALFSGKDAGALEQKNAVALNRVFEAAARINGLGAAFVSEAKADFFDGQSGSSGTVSPGSSAAP